VWSRRRKEDSRELVEQLERCDRCGTSVGSYERTCPSCGSSLVEEKTATLRALRDSDAMTPSAFNAAVEILNDDAARPVAAGGPSIRKQLDEIKPADLHEFAVWEFALDEEGVEGHDEETVRPRLDLARVDPHDGLFIVRAEFLAADGTAFDGFASPHEERHIRYVQPTIVTERRHVRFWFGVVPPDPAVLNASYHALGKTPQQLFPLRYRSLVDTAYSDIAGTVDGFIHSAAGSTTEIVSIR
jgi:hypothetical protein